MLLTVFASTLFFLALGGATGYYLGRYQPGYYRSVFSNGDEATFDPLAVGIGQGVTQGVVCGGLVGLAVILLQAWVFVRTSGAGFKAE